MSLDPTAALDMTPCEYCHNVRASGVWQVVYKVFRTFAMKEMKLCAACGMHKISARVRVFTPKDSSTPVGYHDVVRVNLLRSI